jgi:hypothetical protein
VPLIIAKKPKPTIHQMNYLKPKNFKSKVMKIIPIIFHRKNKKKKQPVFNLFDGCEVTHPEQVCPDLKTVSMSSSGEDTKCLSDWGDKVAIPSDAKKCTGGKKGRKTGETQHESPKQRKSKTGDIAP